MTMKSSEIWLIDLRPTKGDEMSKTRPAIIISSDAVGVLKLKVIIPLTDWKERYSIAPWLMKMSPTPQNGLSKDTAVDTFQIRSLSKQRYVRKLGSVTQQEMTAIKKALATVLEM